MNRSIRIAPHYRAKRAVDGAKRITNRNGSGRNHYVIIPFCLKGLAIVLLLLAVWLRYKKSSSGNAKVTDVTWSQLSASLPIHLLQSNHERDKINRICMVTWDLAGPMLNGGIGTAFRNLAVKLSHWGHNVTILYALGSSVHQSSSLSFKEWQFYFKSKYSINLLPLSADTYLYDSTMAVKVSYEAYLWLQEHEGEFDIIHFHEWQGTPFYSLLAKREGLAFSNVLLAVQTHGPSVWELEGANQFPDYIDWLDVDYMERESVAMSDILISPSSYMLTWFKNRGWRLPNKSFVQPNTMLADFPDLMSKSESEEHICPVGTTIEFVFFGRLENRKGVYDFLDAAKMLLSNKSEEFNLSNTVFTMIGKTVPNEFAAIKIRANELNASIFTSMNPEESAHYLSSSRCRIAVMPSKFENLPSSVMEALSYGIPVITTQSGGTVELFDPRTIGKCCVPRKNTPAHLAAKFQAILSSRELPVCHLHPKYNSVDADWRQWHAYADEYGSKTHYKYKKNSRLPVSYSTKRPKVSVIITTYNPSERILQRTIDSLVRQNYKNFEVILVDDGSTNIPNPLERIRNQFQWRGWKVIKQQNKYIGPARNEGVKHAHGDLLLFMDDDNIAKPEEIETFVNVYEHSQYDILTCFLDEFFTEDPPELAGKETFRWLVTGNMGTMAIQNSLGDANFMISKQRFESLHGFFQHRLAFEDWEFLVRASLKGNSIGIIPKSLFWKRTTRGRDMRLEFLAANSHRSKVKIMNTISENLPGRVGATAYYLHGLIERINTDQNLLIDSRKIKFHGVQGENNVYMCAKLSGTDDWVEVELEPSIHSEDWVSIPSLSEGHFAGFAKHAIHPGIVQGFAFEVAKIWRSTTIGTIAITGKATRESLEGDGVDFRIEVDNKTIVSALLIPDKREFSFYEIVNVNIGSKVAFAVHPRKSQGHDSTSLEFKIESIQETSQEILETHREKKKQIPQCSQIIPGKCAPTHFVVGASYCGLKNLTKLLDMHPFVYNPLKQGYPNDFGVRED